MMFRDTIRTFRKELAKLISPEAVIAHVGGVGSGRIGRQGLTDAQGDAREMMKAFRSLVFACIHVRAKEVSKAAETGVFRVKIRRSYDVIDEAPMDHPLVQLLENPNPYMSRIELWYLTQAFKDLTGNAYWWIARDRLNIPRQLWPLPSERIRIVPGSLKAGEGLIKSYIIDWGMGNRQEIPENDIVQLKHPNPNDIYFYGGSLLMKAAVEVDIAEFIAQHQRDFFKNDAAPAGIVTFPDELSPEVRKEFEQRWLEKFQRKPGKTGYLEGGAKYENIVNQKELDYLESAGINYKKIQSVFGVPDSKLMLEENIQARATLETLDYNFMKETIEPELTIIDAQLTLDLAKTEFDERMFIQHVSVIPKDIRLQSEMDESDLRMGTTSINEIRRRDGKDEWVGGDEPLMTFGLVPLSQVGVDDSVDVTPADEPKVMPFGRTKVMSETEKKDFWKAHERVRLKWERRMSVKLKAYFRRIQKEVVEKVNSKKSLQKDLDSNDFLFNVDDWLRKLDPMIKAEVMAMVKESFERFKRQYSIDGIVFTPNSTEVVEAIGKLTSKTKTIPQTLHDELKAVVDKAIREQLTIDGIAGRVSEFFNNTTDFRAVRIARTNSNYSLNTGNTIAAVQSGQFDGKTWLSQRDSVVRDTHASVDGQQVDLKAKFKLIDGDMLDIPGDPQGKPGNTINCRCTVVYQPKSTE
jgi:HK97 family phage portal protein